MNSHPNVVGVVSGHKVIGDGGRGEKDGDGDPTNDATTSFEFAGKKYHPTGKTGKSLHDDTPVHAFDAEDGHRVWADAKGRVHADSKGEVPELRAHQAIYEATDCIARLKAALESHAKAVGDEPGWHHVGDIGHIAEMLCEVAQFATGESKGRPALTNTDAVADYATQRRVAAENLALLQTHLQEAKTTGIHWGHLGDLQRSAQALLEILRFVDQS